MNAATTMKKATYQNRTFKLQEKFNFMFDAYGYTWHEVDGKDQRGTMWASEESAVEAIKEAGGTIWGEKETWNNYLIHTEGVSIL